MMWSITVMWSTATQGAVQHHGGCGGGLEQGEGGGLPRVTSQSQTLDPEHPTPSILHISTLYPESYTLHHTSTPNALNPAPCTLHPTPYTLHPAPCTEDVVEDWSKEKEEAFREYSLIPQS